MREQAPSGLETETNRVRDWPVSSGRAMRQAPHVAESVQARQELARNPERETMTDATLDWTDLADCVARSARAGATRQRAEGASFPRERRRSVDWQVDRLPKKSKRVDRMRVSSLGTQAVAISTGTPEPWFNDHRSAAGIRTGALFREAIDVGTVSPCVTACLVVGRHDRQTPSGPDSPALRGARRRLATRANASVADDVAWSIAFAPMSTATPGMRATVSAVTAIVLATGLTT